MTGATRGTGKWDSHAVAYPGPPGRQSKPTGQSSQNKATGQSSQNKAIGQSPQNKPNYVQLGFLPFCCFGGAGGGPGARSIEARRPPMKR